MGLCAVGALVEVLGRHELRREQAARRYLGDRLFAAVRGQGPPVVFLAGLTGSTSYWGHAFDAVARDRRLVFVDALGFGRSPWPDGRYTLDDQLGALRRTLMALGIDRGVTIVAHSFGTVLAAYYAAAHPAEIEHLVLLGTPVFDSQAQARERVRGLSPMARLLSLSMPLAREACLAMGASRPLLERVLPLVVPKLPRAVVADSVLHSWPALRGSFEVLLTRPIARPLGAIGGIGGKVTFVHGTRDKVTPLARIHQLAERIGAKVVEVPSDHLGYREKARDVVVRLIARRGPPPKRGQAAGSPPPQVSR